jgi:hypothetical protein
LEADLWWRDGGADLPIDDTDKIGLLDQCILVDMNDNGADFEEIADFIESTL